MAIDEGEPGTKVPAVLPLAARRGTRMFDGKWIEGLGPLLTVAEAARIALQVRLEVVRYFLPLAMHESDRDPEHVHRLRVGTRRAGAALRIFADALPSKLHRKAKKTLRSIRQAAGEARDWDV